MDFADPSPWPWATNPVTPASKSGRAVPVDKNDYGAELVETAFLMEGILGWREYFQQDNEEEKKIRRLADELWRGTEWDWFAGEDKGTHFLHWHWSPVHGARNEGRIIGFNECQIVYVLGLASPTHPIAAPGYWQGWQPDYYGYGLKPFGIPMELGAYDPAPPEFWTEYSYLGMDPRDIAYKGRTYFQHFQNICAIDLIYAGTRKNQFKGYDEFWGWTAGFGPDGFHVFAPGKEDNGTLSPSAALASMPYVPEASLVQMIKLYTEDAGKLWGPFGFWNGFNPSRKWVAPNYSGNEVGPIGPMIENYRSGLCWRTFMRAPEIKAALKIIAAGPAR